MKRKSPVSVRERQSPVFSWSSIDALQVIAVPSNFRIICVPPGEIQTKPRALNYGLQFAQGQYVCVYDAEDRIRSDQIKAAVRAFQRDRESRFAQPLACLQSPLVPHNGNEIKVTRIMALEGLNLLGPSEEEKFVSLRDLNIVTETVQINNDDIKNPDAIPAIT